MESSPTCTAEIKYPTLMPMIFAKKAIEVANTRSLLGNHRSAIIPGALSYQNYVEDIKNGETKKMVNL